MGRPTCRGCGVGFICGGGGVANTTECPGGNEGCKRQEVISIAEKWDRRGIESEEAGRKKWSTSAQSDICGHILLFSQYQHLFIFK